MERGGDSRESRFISTVSVHVVYWPSRARSNLVRVVRGPIRIGLRVCEQVNSPEPPSCNGWSHIRRSYD